MFTYFKHYLKISVYYAPPLPKKYPNGAYGNSTLTTYQLYRLMHPFWTPGPHPQIKKSLRVENIIFSNYLL